MGILGQPCSGPGVTHSWVPTKKPVETQWFKNPVQAHFFLSEPLAERLAKDLSSLELMGGVVQHHLVEPRFPTPAILGWPGCYKWQLINLNLFPHHQSQGHIERSAAKQIADCHSFVFRSNNAPFVLLDEN